ncbi:4'-phosphopantetheinyl transferase superfamily protein [Methylobacterium sp. WL30]|nr:4'-phosphopantetheinyl transferase superfamily protein [Methylobacterium sp. WL93]TXN48819.1 4'-phosphopantetheinyl transferase superfamily protein [Methylobacterium sp. WL119]TXN65784.1 4'-phosphopantetheinyl transferase superfamily protein [Methylobacterium sp. WL30]
MTEPGPSTAIRVWSIDLALSAGQLARCDAWLSPDEAARADRFLRVEDRDRFRASHAALRLILAPALGLGGDALAFTAGPAGKPELAGALAGSLRFNLSHSGTRALVGVSPTAAIGVDVEAVRPIPDVLRIARAHFAPWEAEALAALTSEALGLAFTGLWTRKEAVVKALGAGLSLPLDRFALTLPPAPPRLVAIDGDDPQAWSLHHLEPGSGTVGAAAIRAPGAAIARCALPPDWPDRPPC